MVPCLGLRKWLFGCCLYLQSCIQEQTPLPNSSINIQTRKFVWRNARIRSSGILNAVLYVGEGKPKMWYAISQWAFYRNGYTGRGGGKRLMLVKLPSLNAAFPVA